MYEIEMISIPYNLVTTNKVVKWGALNRSKVRFKKLIRSVKIGFSGV
jgi:hypothetical protein